MGRWVDGSTVEVSTFGLIFLWVSVIGVGGDREEIINLLLPGLHRFFNYFPPLKLREIHPHTSNTIRDERYL